MANHKFQILIACIILLIIGILVISYQHPDIKPKEQQAKTQNLEPETSTTTLFFAGDIMLSRNVASKIYTSNDFALPFEKVKDQISQSDISFANLESPFNNTGNHSVPNSLVFNADPKSIEGLKVAGFNILSTANNHALDQGIKGLDFTINLLKTNGIIPTGTTSTTQESILPVITKNKLSFGFLSYSYAAKNDNGKIASPLVNNFDDLAKLKQDILALKGHYADIVIVNMHAGTEYTRNPTAQQIAFAHAAIDAGADLVIGEHSHWVQTIEEYKGKWIFYSLGNFVFDQMWSQETKEGLTVFVTYENQHIPDPKNETAGEDRVGIKKIELKPVIIDNYCCVRWANADETKSILGKINPLTDSSIIMQNGIVNPEWTQNKSIK